MSIQMGIYALACGLNTMNKSYNKFFNSLLVLILAGVIFVGSGYVLHTMDEYRKKHPWNYVLLGVGTAGYAMFVASLGAIISVELFFVMIFGGFMAVLSCYVTSRYTESTKERDDAMDNLKKGLGAGLIANIVTTAVILSVAGSKSMVLGIGLSSIVFAVAGLFIGWVTLFIIIPSLDEDGADSEDIIGGVVRIYVEKMLLGWRLAKLALEKCKGTS